MSWGVYRPVVFREQPAESHANGFVESLREDALIPFDVVFLSSPKMTDWAQTKRPAPSSSSEPSEDANVASKPSSPAAAETPAVLVRRPLLCKGSPRGPTLHKRQSSRNFSETDFMDSGLGRSLNSELPVLGLQDELDSLQFDDVFVEEYLLSKLQDAQRRLQEIRDYKSRMGEPAEEATISAGLPPRQPRNVSPLAGPPLLPPRKSRKQQRLFVASFRLPLTVEMGDDGEVKSSVSSGSLGLFSAFKDLLGRLPIKWLGAPGQTFHDVTSLPPEERRKMERHFTSKRQRKSMGLLSYVPLFPDAEDAVAHQEFCNSVMWPLFHYIPLNLGERTYHNEMFEAYERVNHFYGNALIDEWKRSGCDEADAMFWIHDFHLLLVPKLLRDRLPNARIGFFLHTPFPAGEVFRALGPRKELLEGVLGADLLGFHTYDYARHFLSACERLLGLTVEPNAVDNKGVCVQVGIYPFGIDADTFRAAMKQSTVKDIHDQLRESFTGKKIIVGVDRLDYIKGIPHKLLAIEHFLETHPDWIGRVVVLQVTTPSMSASEEYQAFRSEILEMVGRINGRFATVEDMPIHYREHTMTFEELCALYSVADIAIITSLRDGMNLVSHEYIVCQKERKGVLILSEFTGAAQNLPGALLVNPWNIEEVSDAIYQSLEMPDFERELKHQKLYRHVVMHTASAWGVRFIDDLVKYSSKRKEKAKKLVDMPRDKICKSYRETKGKRLFFLDYDGTLRKYESQPELAEPTPRLLEALRRLSSSDQNIVFIVTGRQKSTMVEWFDGVGVGFAVEHGFSIRWPDHLRGRLRGKQDGELYMNGKGSSSGGRSNEVPQDSTWDDLMSAHDLIAMRDALEVAGSLLRRIEDCTPTSFLSQKESAYSWHFRDADPDFAVSRAHDARQALEEVLAGSPMEVLMGQKILYVRPKGVHKGAAVREVLRLLEEKKECPSWVCSVGDDRTDEDMFDALYQATRDTNVVVNTCTVGRRTTAAKYYVQSVDDVLGVLEDLGRTQRGSAS